MLFIVYGNPGFLPQVMHKLNYAMSCDTGIVIDFKAFDFDVAVDKFESGVADQISDSFKTGEAKNGCYFQHFWFSRESISLGVLAHEKLARTWEEMWDCNVSNKC